MRDRLKWMPQLGHLFSIRKGIIIADVEIDEWALHEEV